MIAKAKSEEIENKTNHRYLNFDQMVSKIDILNSKLNELKFDGLNQTRELLSLKNRLSIYKRLKLLLATHDVPRLTQLIRIANKNGNGLQHIVY